MAPNSYAGKSLPDYIFINDLTVPDLKRSALRIPSEDKMILSILEAKHDTAKGCVTGIAAPQIV